jgi:hypothetical protein
MIHFLSANEEKLRTQRVKAHFCRQPASAVWRYVEFRFTSSAVWLALNEIGHPARIHYPLTSRQAKPVPRQLSTL